MGTQLAHHRLWCWSLLRWICQRVSEELKLRVLWPSNESCSVIGQVNTILKTLYKTDYTHSSAQSNVNSIAFAGTVVGQLFFGFLSDKWSRKWALVISTVILFIFAALSAGAYGGGSINGMLSALTAWRFLLGIGIGYERSVIDSTKRG